MYSYEERITAVKLYIQYDLQLAATIRELGYPERSQLPVWYKEYIETGDLHKDCRKPSKYTDEQMKQAVDYYWEHGRSLSRTIKKLGYPCRVTLKSWINKLSPETDQLRTSPRTVVKFTEEQKRDAVIELCLRETSAKDVAKRQGTTRAQLYNWKYKMLGKEYRSKMEPDKDLTASDDPEVLQEQLNELKRQIVRQQMELDALRMASELIKKEEGFNLQKMNNKEKTLTVEALRNDYPLEDLLALFGLPRLIIPVRRIIRSAAS